MSCGIYKITNTINGKVYIGSSVYLSRRFKEHMKCLRGEYKNTNPHLQRAWNKYGEDSFVFGVLLYCDEENLAFYEQRAIDEYKSLDNKFGYNCMPASRSDLTGSNAEEMIRKRSGINHGMYGVHRYGKDNPFYGKKHTEETRQQMSESGKKKKLSEKHKDNISKVTKGKNNPFYGKYHTEESKRKISGKNHYGAKAVIINGKHYNTMTEAAKNLGVCRPTIAYRLKTNKPGYKYV